MPDHQDIAFLKKLKIFLPWLNSSTTRAIRKPLKNKRSFRKSRLRQIYCPKPNVKLRTSFWWHLTSGCDRVHFQNAPWWPRKKYGAHQLRSSSKRYACRIFRAWRHGCICWKTRTAKMPHTGARRKGPVNEAYERTASWLLENGC